ncbi:MAG: phosphoribosyl-AMP cyclohydrolase [bacterium]
MTNLCNELKLGPGQLIPAIIQDAESKDILMLAYMNPETLRLTIETGITHFWSRSRNCLWKKGETSGNTQEVLEILYDCDVDTLLIKVKQNGPACHTGYRTCFYRQYQGDDKEPKIVSQQIASSHP